MDSTASSHGCICLKPILYVNILALPARRVWQLDQTVNHVWPFSSLPSVISEFKSVNAVYQSSKSLSFYLKGRCFCCFPLMELESSVGIKKKHIKARKNNPLIITVVFSSVMEDAQCTSCHCHLRYHLWVSVFGYLFSSEKPRVIIDEWLVEYALNSSWLYQENQAGDGVHILYKWENIAYELRYEPWYEATMDKATWNIILRVLEF